MVSAQCQVWGRVLSVVGVLVMGGMGQSWGYEVITVSDGGTISGQVKLVGMADTPRSEERRVGKECRL